MQIDHNQNYHAETQTIEQVDTVRTFMRSVFSWMFLALSVTAVTAFFVANNAGLQQALWDQNTGMKTLGWIVTLSPLAFVLIMSGGFHRFSFGTLSLLFMIYAVLVGMSLSFILLVFTETSIFTTFVVTAGTFGLMAFMGYTTKTDLTKFGSIMMMGLFGIIIASVVNFFMHSSSLQYIISFVGVLVFTGLTAYDVQKLKRIALGQQYGQSTMGKLVIMGALNLYLDFINLFLFLLRFLGDRK